MATTARMRSVTLSRVAKLVSAKGLWEVQHLDKKGGQQLYWWFVKHIIYTSDSNLNPFIRKKNLSKASLMIDYHDAIFDNIK
jgi:hypothetical protein